LTGDAARNTIFDMQDRRSHPRQLTCVPASLESRWSAEDLALIRDASVSGARLFTGVRLEPNEEVLLNLFLEPDSERSRQVRARVVRCEPTDVALPGAAVWRQQDFALGVLFLDQHHDLAAAIGSLAKQTGMEHSQARVLVLGKDDEVSRLVDKALSDAEYKPRILTHPRYAVSTAKRIAALPDVPTIAEAGFPAAESTFWLAMLAPAKTPAEIVAKVNGEVLRALQSVELKERLAKLGTEPMSMTPAESDAFIRREYEVLGKIMRDAGLTPQ